MSRKAYPHERRLQRYAAFALALAVVLAAILVATGRPRAFGVELPGALPWALLVVAAAGMLAAIFLRITWLAFAAGGLLALAVVPAAQPQPGIGGYALGLAFGAALLATGELVHMMARYGKAHRAVDHEGVPEEHINRVTDESLRTLAMRAGLALAGGALAVAVALLLSLAGPRQWRASPETSGPLGVALAALVIAGIVSLSILARGARLRRDEKHEPKEVLPDVAE